MHQEFRFRNFHTHTRDVVLYQTYKRRKRNEVWKNEKSSQPFRGQQASSYPLDECRGFRLGCASLWSLSRELTWNARNPGSNVFFIPTDKSISECWWKTSWEPYAGLVHSCLNSFPFPELFSARSLKTLTTTLNDMFIGNFTCNAFSPHTGWNLKSTTWEKREIVPGFPLYREWVGLKGRQVTWRCKEIPVCGTTYSFHIQFWDLPSSV